MAGEYALDVRPATSSAPMPVCAGLAYRYTRSKAMSRMSRQHIANRASVAVHPTPVYIGVRTAVGIADTATGTSAWRSSPPIFKATPPCANTLTLTRVQVEFVPGGGQRLLQPGHEEVKVPAGEWTTSPLAVPIPVPEGGSHGARHRGAGQRRRQ